MSDAQPFRTPKYRLHRPSGQAVVTLEGHDFYLGPHGTASSRREYDRLIAEWLGNGRRLPGGEAEPSITIVELMAAYVRFAKSYYVKNGNPTSEQASIKQAIRPLKG